MSHHTMGGKSPSWAVISTRIPPDEFKKFVSRHPERGKRSQVMRALLQMYLSGKVNKLEFSIIERID